MARLSLVAVAAALAALLVLANAALPSTIAVLTKTRHCTGACTGKFEFVPNEDGTTNVTVTLTGFPANARLGVHIHQFGDLASVDATAAGGHFNPYGTNHSCSGEDRHVGDLGNVDTDANGNAVVTFSNLTSMLDNTLSSFILGRMVVVHEREDDCVSQPAGNAGNRLAQGVIGLANGSDLPADSAETVSDLTYGYATLRERDGSGVFAEVTIDGDDDYRYFYTVAVGLQPQETYSLYLMNFGDLDDFDDEAFYDPDGEVTCTNMPGYIGDVTADEFGFVYDTNLLTPSLTLTRSVSSMLGRAIVITSSADCRDAVYAAGIVGIRGSAAWPKARAVARLRGVPSSNLPEDAVVTVTAQRAFINGRSSAVFEVTAESGEFPANYNVSVHVREFGDATNVDGTSFGGIFNPTQAAHGCNGNGEAGGLGNIAIQNSSGTQTWYFFSPLASLDATEPGFIMSRGVAIVSNTDSCAAGFTPGTPLLTGILGYDYEYDSPNAQALATPPNADPTKVQATCILKPTSGNIARGSVQIVPQGEGVDVYVTINNLVPNSLHGFHVHQFGDDRSTSGSYMGGHFNPLGYNHSCAPTQLRHAGDLGNIQADKNGRVYAKIHTKLLTLAGSGVSSAFGRGIILHQNPDDCITQPTGNAGNRLAQCVIGLSTVRPVVTPTGEPTPTPTKPDDGSGAASLSTSLTALAVVAAGFLAARA